eukprot:scaffold98623_cov13-Prasinocladus_malaysianus.AAC.1
MSSERAMEVAPKHILSPLGSAGAHQQPTIAHLPLISSSRNRARAVLISNYIVWRPLQSPSALVDIIMFVPPNVGFSAGDGVTRVLL